MGGVPQRWCGDARSAFLKGHFLSDKKKTWLLFHLMRNWNTKLLRFLLNSVYVPYTALNCCTNILQIYATFLYLTDVNGLELRCWWWSSDESCYTWRFIFLTWNMHITLQHSSCMQQKGPLKFLLSVCNFNLSGRSCSNPANSDGNYNVDEDGMVAIRGTVLTVTLRRSKIVLMTMMMKTAV